MSGHLASEVSFCKWSDMVTNWKHIIHINIDVREGASGASADAPGVGLEMVSGLKLLKKDEKMEKK